MPATTADRQPTTAADTVPGALSLRSAAHPDEIAYVFLRNGEEPGDTLTYRELDEAARARAARFGSAGLTGRNAVLLYPSSPEFIVALMGCMYAGVVGAPVQVPRRRHGVEHLRRIADDAGTATVLTTAEVKHDLEQRFGDLPELRGLTLVDTDSAPPDDVPPARPAEPHPDAVALLQYTSGSTGDPKGVMVTHANFRSNVLETESLWPCGPGTVFVSWLPLFHDMGLLFGVLLPVWAGVPSYLMAPEAFIRRPARWLEAVARFRGTHSAAPSFAYELCARAAREGRTTHVGDLSSWRIAANGAEPVRWHTIRSFARAFAPHGFDPRAMTPGYGLAENTLKATGTAQDRAPATLTLSSVALGEGRVEPADETGAATTVVSSGAPTLDTAVRIVDPVTREPCPPDRVGEIWISGPCVAAGYFGRPELSEETFRARIRGVPDAHLRTGDLGFLRDGELYVTGRLKDVIVHRGRNHYPQDVESSAEEAVSGLHPNCAAAFAVDDGAQELLVLVVEADGRVLRDPGAAALRKRVHDAVHEDHRLTADRVLVVRRGALPRTSSGKVQRRACAERYADGSLAAYAVPQDADAAPPRVAR